MRSRRRVTRGCRWRRSFGSSESAGPRTTTGSRSTVVRQLRSLSAYAMSRNQTCRTMRRLPIRPRQPLIAPTRNDAIGALDCMHDSFYGRWTFRTLNVIEQVDRQRLGIGIANRIPGSLRSHRCRRHPCRGRCSDCELSDRRGARRCSLACRGVSAGLTREWCRERPTRTAAVDSLAVLHGSLTLPAAAIS